MVECINYHVDYLVFLMLFTFQKNDYTINIQNQNVVALMIFEDTLLNTTLRLPKWLVCMQHT